MKKSYHSSADPTAAASMTWRRVLGDTRRAVPLIGTDPAPPDVRCPLRLSASRCKVIRLILPLLCFYVDARSSFQQAFSMHALQERNRPECAPRSPSLVEPKRVFVNVSLI